MKEWHKGSVSLQYLYQCLIRLGSLIKSCKQGVGGFCNTSYSPRNSGLFLHDRGEVEGFKKFMNVSYAKFVFIPIPLVPKLLCLSLTSQLLVPPRMTWVGPGLLHDSKISHPSPCLTASFDNLAWKCRKNLKPGLSNIFQFPLGTALYVWEPCVLKIYCVLKNITFKIFF